MTRAAPAWPRARPELKDGVRSSAGDLAGFLLAEHGHVEDVWLHWKIKRSSFDAWCGYDAEHLIAAGVDATIAYVRAGDHADRDAVLERLPAAAVDLAAWWRVKRARFPADPADEE